MNRLRRGLAPSLVALLAVPAHAAVARPGGTWQGVYRCAQGKTAMALTIRPSATGRIRAVFYFHAQAGNPGVPTGCFAMTGHYDKATRRLVLKPTLWLQQPAHFVWVGLSGRIKPGGRAMTGRIKGPGCSHFTVTRSDMPVRPPPPAACRLERNAPTV